MIFPSAAALKAYLQSCNMQNPMQFGITDIKPTKRLHAPYLSMQEIISELSENF